ncbi:LINE-1 type transposase domain-containing 1 [Scomber scombrus]|uniref:LINE-1 type transposase domain-containing 1 n=1 Tax=Scomber scombrus TaxID=13677 RepID=A0AAV1PT23_SCOSC
MCLQTLWDAIQQSKEDMLSHFNSKVDPIQSSLTNIQNSMSTLGEQVQMLEQRVGANEDIGHELVVRVKQLEKDNAYLLDKVDDLENLSRHSNLRFVGVQENAEGSDMIGFMSRLIPQLLGQDAFPTPVIIERAHRSPTARQGDQSSLRSILITLLNFQDKVKILRLARVKKILEFNGKRISIYSDFSPDLSRRRRSFDPVKRKLCELNMKYFLRYPAMLCVVVDGKQQRFLETLKLSLCPP